mmetsp:Transcript_9052/g.22464  ORF Transcript_9052/g.22464 Transcript_9052/m.22464 type:complete len:224 (-) Transcript_9052:65-736(-)
MREARRLAGSSYTATSSAPPSSQAGSPSASGRACSSPSRAASSSSLRASASSPPPTGEPSCRRCSSSLSSWASLGASHRPASSACSRATGGGPTPSGLRFSSPECPSPSFLSSTCSSGARSRRVLFPLAPSLPSSSCGLASLLPSRSLAPFLATASSPSRTLQESTRSLARSPLNPGLSIPGSTSSCVGCFLSGQSLSRSSSSSPPYGFTSFTISLGSSSSYS